jgi:t-SNARE complex subunit (syntaxin)
MPQSERANVLKEIMRWLAAQEKGATLQALRHHIKWEITEGGATDTTIKKYIQDLGGAQLIEYETPFWRVTNNGKMWLEQHCI